MYFIVSVILIIFMLIVPGRADARKWRVKPSDLAADYSQIIDQRAGNEVVVIYWVAPETMDASIQNVEAFRSMLRDYIIVGAAHGTASQTGRLNFRVPEGLVVQSGDGKARQPLAKETWPPLVTAFSTVIQNFMSQSMGQLGEGFNWFVFEGKGIESCGKGRFWVAYAGERYNYETPIPGCSQSGGAPQQ
jgi:hypothetical protein